MNKCLVLLAVSFTLAAPVHAADFAIVQVTVIPMDSDQVLPAQTVIVRDGRIAVVGPANRTVVAPDLTVIDGRGRYLMPGLAEMHAHVPPQPNQVQWTEDILFLFVANGVTFARSMLGAPHHLELRDRAASGALLSPRLYLSGPSLNGNSVGSPEDGRRMVTEQHAAGYDFLKIHPGLDPARFAAIVETAHAVGIAFGGHVSDAVGLDAALAARQATIDHLDSYLPAMVPGQAAAPSFFGWNLAGEADAARIPELAARTAEAGVWNVPTESLIRHVLAADPGTDALLARNELRYVPAAMVAQWRQARAGVMANPQYDAALMDRFIELRAALLRALRDAGGGLLLGSDAPQIFNVPGFSIHHELLALVDAGLTPFEALSTGTREVARFLGEEADMGTVTVGKRADLVLLELNPLANIANTRSIVGVMVNGRWVSRDELDAGLAEIATRNQTQEQ